MKRFLLNEIFKEKQILNFADSIISSTQNLVIKIVNPRKTKYGTMQYLPKTNSYCITINNNLNLYFSLYIFLHEYAHVLAHRQYRYTIKPHGKEWQYIFFDLLNQAIHHKVFPETVVQEISQQFLKKRIYSKQRDFKIKQSINNLSENKSHHYYLMNCTPGQTFTAYNRNFIILKKFRTRFLCKDLSNNRMYYISGYLPIS